jgi:hypothetical protein
LYCFQHSIVGQISVILKRFLGSLGVYRKVGYTYMIHDVQNLVTDSPWMKSFSEKTSNL